MELEWLIKKDNGGSVEVCNEYCMSRVGSGVGSEPLNPSESRRPDKTASLPSQQVTGHNVKALATSCREKHQKEDF